MSRFCLACLWLFILLPLNLSAKPLNPQNVPEPLKPWMGWVLHEHESQTCPFMYNNGDEHRCAWPTRLELALDDSSGSFTAFWQVDAEGWASLPGDSALWPQQVEVDGKPVAVAARDGLPAVWLLPGVHRLSGRLAWDSLPENLSIPRDSGLIALSVKGKPANPVFNAQGGLWLQGTQGAAKEAVANTLAVRVFRRIVDTIPLRVITHLDLEVAGEQREVLLAGGLLADSIPLELSSPVPARLEPDGRLRVLLRPGRWQIELTSRQPGETVQLGLPENPAEPWPVEEIWSFEARPQTRVVEIQAGQASDPRQTEMPEDWKDLPAYRLAAGGHLKFKTLRRGDPDSAPDRLSLSRTFWLDFDGGGYTVHDDISGRLSRDWRLDALPGLNLGRVDIDDVPQLLTQAGGKTGVEIRRGQVQLSADSRGEGTLTHLPATGWSRDFQSVEATVNLPPGWRVFAVTGADNAPDTWVGRWTLLDLFMVLVIAIGIGKLRGWPSGAVAGIALVLLWHEPDAPRALWLHLLASVVLVHVLPEGRAAHWASVYRNLTLVSLVFVALPFMVQQVRTGIYPQLDIERSEGLMSGLLDSHYLRHPAKARHRALVEDEPSLQTEPASPPPAAAAPTFKFYKHDESASLPSTAESKADKAVEATTAGQFRETDPDALTQTGPGLPQWDWRSVALSWNGPVVASQEIGLILIPPSVNFILNLLRVVLLLALVWVILRGDGWSGKFRALVSGLKPLAVMLLAFLCVPQAKAEMPSPALLEELKTRLLSAPDCLPECAQIAQLRLKLGADGLSEQLEIHAQANVAVPLPAQEGQWLPSKASLDGGVADALFRSADGQLWLGLKPGKHEVVLSGALPRREQVQLALPLRPHRAIVEGGGWRVEGIKENGEPEAQLQLTRTLQASMTAATPELEARPLPPFLEVRRSLRLGLNWRVSTQVIRVSPADAPVMVEIPLLEGESVTSAGLQVKNGKLAVNLAAGQSDLEFESSLELCPTISLTAPQTLAWTEVWRADVSPVWHLESAGLSPVSHQDAQSNRLTEWRPWPGETLSLNLTRPKGAAGSTLTVESSELKLSPGTRAIEASFNISLRSSQGGQHTVIIPRGAALQSVSIDGTIQPIRQQGQSVTLPIRPGAQAFDLAWRQESGITPWFLTPSVNLGSSSVNSTIRVELGRDRWVLLAGGPRLGPAVLFWGVVAVLALLALGLGKLDWTPLKARHWFLLLLGLSQVELVAGACVVGWLFALGWRARRAGELNDFRFNAIQVSLALLTPLALACLFYAIQQGLLGLPDMQVAGNGSSAGLLRWYQDRTGDNLPQAWLVSAPLWSYRVVMLLWALWLAHSLLEWLRWGYGCYVTDGLWRTRQPAPRPGSNSVAKQEAEQELTQAD